MNNAIDDDKYPFVSILIPTLNVGHTIGDVLNSLFNLRYPNDKYEVIILDSFSSDDTKDIALKYPLKFYQIKGTPPVVYNFILNKIKGDFIALADGDAIVDENWLNCLMDCFNEPDIKGAGGLCLTWNKDKLVPRSIGYELQDRYERMPSEISRIATMNVIYKKDVIQEVGGFNEKLPIAYDTDIGHKIKGRGYRIIFEPSAIVYHFNRPTLKSFYKQQYIYGKNVPKLYLKNRKIARGDEVTNLWMNSQPFIYSILLVSLILIPLSRIIGTFVSVVILLILFIAYFIKALKIAIKYKDASALFLIVILFTRGIAWTHGGIIAFFQIIWEKLKVGVC